MSVDSLRREAARLREVCRQRPETQQAYQQGLEEYLRTGELPGRGDVRDKIGLVAEVVAMLDAELKSEEADEKVRAETKQRTSV